MPAVLENPLQLSYSSLLSTFFTVWPGPLYWNTTAVPGVGEG